MNIFGVSGTGVSQAGATLGYPMSRHGILARLDQAQQEGDVSLALTLIEALYRRLDSYEGVANFSGEQPPP